MESKPGPDDLRIAFLAPLQPAENVFLGGLLVTNRLGRPLEFQCTEPVEPNRTQVLLYGPTLRPYVLTELIGRTLLERVSVEPHLLLVDSAEMLPLRKLVPIPLAVVAQEGASEEQSIGRQPATWHPHFPHDREIIRRCATLVPRDADVAEPFERVRAALQEALGSAVPRSRVA